jgi:hypothetical protein
LENQENELRGLKEALEVINRLWFIHSFIHSFTHWFIDSLIHSLIHWFIHSFIHWFIHSFIVLIRSQRQNLFSFLTIKSKKELIWLLSLHVNEIKWNEMLRSKGVQTPDTTEHVWKSIHDPGLTVIFQICPPNVQQNTDFNLKVHIFIKAKTPFVHDCYSHTV